MLVVESETRWLQWKWEEVVRIRQWPLPGTRGESWDEVCSVCQAEYHVDTLAGIFTSRFYIANSDNASSLSHPLFSPNRLSGTRACSPLSTLLSPPIVGHIQQLLSSDPVRGSSCWNMPKPEKEITFSLFPGVCPKTQPKTHKHTAVYIQGDTVSLQNPQPIRTHPRITPAPQPRRSVPSTTTPVPASKARAKTTP